VNNLIVLAARKAIKKYYEFWLVPDDAAQGDYKTRQITLRGNGIWAHGHRVRAHLMYSANELYTQLVYLHRLCQDSASTNKLKLANAIRARASKKELLHASVLPEDALPFVNARRDLVNNGFLKESAFAWVGPDFWQKCRGGEVDA